MNLKIKKKQIKKIEQEIIRDKLIYKTGVKKGLKHIIFKCLTQKLDLREIYGMILLIYMMLLKNKQI